MSTMVDDGTVFVGWSTNRKLSALDLKTGQLKWDALAGSHTYTTAVVVGDTVSWGSADGQRHTFHKTTGEPLGTYEVGSEIYSSPTVVDGTFYFGTGDGRLLAFSEAPARAQKAVFLPTDIPDGLRAFIIDDRLADYFVARGYDLLDSGEALLNWVTAQATADTRSSLVFAYPLIPDPVIGPEPGAGPLRTYLKAGGKVIWTWGIPNKLTFNADGSFEAYDPTVAEHLLDIKAMGFEDGGNYHANATQLGRNWGLPPHPKTTFAFLDPAHTDTVETLAIDEYGRPGAWVKTFVDRPGTGWVTFLPSGFGVAFTDAQLATLERVANIGLE